MAKELPYYKHEPSEWLEGEIQICSDAAIVCFQNLCSGYWLKLGCMSYAFALQKYCRRDASILQELIDSGIVDKKGDDISIKFLDKQLSEFSNVSEKRSNAAKKRWSDANALQVDSKSNAIREDKRREDEKKEENTIPTKEDFLAHGLSKMPDVSIEALRMKYESWIENDWCTNKDGKKRKIQNWKSTLNNTLPFLPKQPKDQKQDKLVLEAERQMRMYGLSK
jgi:hypothetical protein